MDTNQHGLKMWYHLQCPPLVQRSIKADFQSVTKDTPQIASLQVHDECDY